MTSRQSIPEPIEVPIVRFSVDQESSKLTPGSLVSSCDDREIVDIPDIAFKRPEKESDFFGSWKIIDQLLHKINIEQRSTFHFMQTARLLVVANALIQDTMTDPKIMSRIRPKHGLEKFYHQWMNVRWELVDSTMASRSCSWSVLLSEESPSVSIPKAADLLHEILEDVQFSMAPWWQSRICLRESLWRPLCVASLAFGAIGIVIIGYGEIASLVFWCLSILCTVVVLALLWPAKEIVTASQRVRVNAHIAYLASRKVAINSFDSFSGQSVSNLANSNSEKNVLVVEPMVEEPNPTLPPHNTSPLSGGITIKIPPATPPKSDLALHGTEVTHMKKRSASAGDTNISKNGTLVFAVGSESDPKYLSVDAGLIHEHIMLVGLRENLSIALWNRGAEIFTGFDMGTCLGSNVMGLVSEESRAVLSKAIESTKMGIPPREAVRVNMLHSKKLGVSVMIHVVNASISEGTGGGYFIVGHEEKNSENGMKQFQTIMVSEAHTHAKAILKICEERNSTAPKKIGQHITQCLRFIQCLHPDSITELSNKWSSFPVIDIHQFNGDTVGAMSLYKEQVKVDYNLDNDVPDLVKWENEKLPDMIRFILRNATLSGGTSVRISLKKTEDIGLRDETITFIEVSISDNGKGFSSKELAKIHSNGAFSSANSETYRSPTKLREPNPKEHRMVLITEVLENTGATLMCNSVENEGTTITVRFPYLSAVGTPQNDTMIVQPDSRRLDIVLLDVNPMYRTGLTHTLWQRSHSVCLAVDFKDLVSIIEGNAPHIIFCQSTFVPSELSNEFGNMVKDLSATSTICILGDKESAEFEREKYKELGVHWACRPLSNEDLSVIIELVISKVNKEKERQAQIAKVRSIFTEHNSCTWEKVKKLGSGAFGDVYQARNTTTGGTMAVKVIKISAEDRDAEQKVQDLVNEVALLRQLEHDNIIHYLYCEPGQGCINVFMEFANGGTVSGVIEQKGALSVAKAAGYTRELLKAVAYLHENHIMHRDIKCANLLLSDGKLKLGDFGTAHRLTETPCTEMKGTLRFMAPEVCKEEPHDYSCDIWSIGCTVMEMLTGMQPLPHIEGNYLQVIAQLSSMTNETVIPVPRSIQGNARSFISSCLCVNAALRPTAKTLLNHPFLTQSELTNRKKSTFESSSAVQKLKNKLSQARLNLSRRRSGQPGHNSSSTVNLNVSLGAADESDKLLESESDYYDRKFSGWGEPADNRASSPNKKQVLPLPDDDGDERKRSVWCKY